MLYPISYAGTTVQLIAEGDMVVHRHRKEGYFEPESLTWWCRWCRGNTRVLDIGTYSGVYSLLASMRGAEVLAFEPNPKLVERLKENAKVNGVEISVIRAAAGSKGGPEAVTHLHLNSRVPFTSGASVIPGNRQHTTKISVPSVKVDDYVKEHVDAVKIDVEGAELSVLQGMPEVLSKSKPNIIVELLGAVPVLSVTSYLMDFGYTLTRVCDGRNYVFASEKETT